MDNNQTGKSKTQIRRSMRLCAIAVLVTAISFINITKRSNIRAVEVLTILACGIAIGAFIVNLSLLIKLKKQNDLTETI